MVDKDYLTKRELEVIKYVARGYMNKSIAAKMGISTRTIEVHISAIKKKLHCKTRGELIIAAIKLSVNIINESVRSA